MDRQEGDSRTEADALGTGGDGGVEQLGNGRGAELDLEVLLREPDGGEAQLVGQRNLIQCLTVALLRALLRANGELIEDAEFHPRILPWSDRGFRRAAKIPGGPCGHEPPAGSVRSRLTGAHCDGLRRWGVAAAGGWWALASAASRSDVRTRNASGSGLPAPRSGRQTAQRTAGLTRDSPSHLQRVEFSSPTSDSSGEGGKR